MDPSVQLLREFARLYRTLNPPPPPEPPKRARPKVKLGDILGVAGVIGMGGLLLLRLFEQVASTLPLVLPPPAVPPVDENLIDTQPITQPDGSVVYEAPA